MSNARQRKSWDTGRRVLRADRGPLIMGILNVTPDSFSDGGKHLRVDDAVVAGQQMAAHGADMFSE